MQARNIKKLYYSISEVSEITDLKQYVLRYWETEFSQLNPKKNSAGNRTYRTNDIDIILEIKSLLYERKFTIKGAKQYFKTKRSLKPIEPMVNNKIIKITNSAEIKLLKDLKVGISEISKILSQYKD